MYINPYEVHVDIEKTNTLELKKDITFIEGDYKTCVIDFYLLSNGETLNLNELDFTVVLKGKNDPITQECTIEEVLYNNKLTRIVRYELPNDIISENSNYNGALLMYNKGSLDVRRTLVTFKLSIKEQTRDTII